jgi:glutathione S-transferase
MLRRKLFVPQGAVEGCNPGTVVKAKEELLGRLRILDTVLLSRTFLVGERLTLADAALCLTLLPAYSLVLGKYRYHETI